MYKITVLYSNGTKISNDYRSSGVANSELGRLLRIAKPGTNGGDKIVSISTGFGCFTSLAYLRKERI